MRRSGESSSSRQTTSTGRRSSGSSVTLRSRSGTWRAQPALTSVTTSSPAGHSSSSLARLDPADATEIGEVLLRRAAGRRGDEITVMGHVAEDIAAAELVYAAARREGAGMPVEL